MRNKDHSKDGLEDINLPQGFDQRFFKKLDIVKKEMAPMKPKIHERVSKFWNEFFSLFAPLGLAASLGTLIMLSTSVPTTQLDWQERAEVLNEIEVQEITALSTLPDRQWDDLISSAD